MGGGADENADAKPGANRVQLLRVNPARATAGEEANPAEETGDNSGHDPANWYERKTSLLSATIQVGYRLGKSIAACIQVQSLASSAIWLHDAREIQCASS